MEMAKTTSLFYCQLWSFSEYIGVILFGSRRLDVQTFLLWKLNFHSEEIFINEFIP